MELQDAIAEIAEEWRKKRGLSQIDAGQAVFPTKGDPKTSGDKWRNFVSGRKTAKKKRRLTIDELAALAALFYVDPETLIIQARQRMGLIYGTSKMESVENKAS